MPRPSRLRRLTVIVTIALATGLAGCSTTVTLEPAPSANDPACAEVSVRLPGSVDGQIRRWTDAQATGAWGDPAAVILACGVTPPGPTDQRCITVGGVDWIVDESDAPRYRVTSYGRTPAVQVYLDNTVVDTTQSLNTLGPIVALLPSGAECTDPDVAPQ